MLCQTVSVGHIGWSNKITIHTLIRARSYRIHRSIDVSISIRAMNVFASCDENSGTHSQGERDYVCERMTRTYTCYLHEYSRQNTCSNVWCTSTERDLYENQEFHSSPELRSIHITSNYCVALVRITISHLFLRLFSKISTFKFNKNLHVSSWSIPHFWSRHYSMIDSTLDFCHVFFFNLATMCPWYLYNYKGKKVFLRLWFLLVKF